ncbi:MAG: hypothetical protein Q8S24_08595 [Eubacteriales bacterium]|nr:hypothetical protein [Eubacteriales bacterium]
MDLEFDRQKLIADWAKRFRGLSEKKEYAAFIYSIDKGGIKRYYMGHTYSGFGRNKPFKPNVIIPFIYFYAIESILEWFKRGSKVECFIHTHPKPDAGFTYRHFSSVDSKLLRLGRIRSVCLVPFENNDINFINQ